MDIIIDPPRHPKPVPAHAPAHETEKVSVPQTKRTYMILHLAADWWGSDSRALTAALRRHGHSVIEIGYEDFFPNKWSSLPLKILRKLIAPLCVRNYNQAIMAHAENPAIDILLVFKGWMLTPETLAKFKIPALRKICFYPDVSLLDHGPHIMECLPLYDSFITTKSFHLTDPVIRAQARKMHFVLHGFDKDVHRPTPVSDRMRAHYSCDVSFVGCWSPSKEDHLAAVIGRCPKLDIQIWGPGWNRAADPVQKFWRRRGIYGDEMVALYQMSKINLGLLSEAGGGTTEGDQTTARTWQIPACGGFMIHQHTEEFIQHFNPQEEVPTFRSPEELASKVEFFLRHDPKRNKLAQAAHRRCIRSDYSYDRAAIEIIRVMDEELTRRRP